MYQYKIYNDGLRIYNHIEKGLKMIGKQDKWVKRRGVA